MRILHVVPHFFPAVAFGGPPVVVYNLASEMAKREDVTVYTTDVLDKTRRINSQIPRKLNNVNVYYFRNLSHTLAAKYNFYLPFAMFSELIKNWEKFDIIHSHEFYTSSHILTAALINKSKKVHVLSGHGTLKPLSAAGRLLRKNIYNKLFSKFIFSTVSAFIANTKAEYEEYLDLKIPKHKIRLIPNGIDINEYRVKRVGEAKSLLYLGRIQQKKGIELLINAVTILVREFPDLKCYIVGPSEDSVYFSKLQNMVLECKIAKNIKFRDTVISKEKSTLLANSGILVLPSYGEGLATILLEGAAAKIPLVATRAGAPSEFIAKEAIQVSDMSGNDIAVKIRLLLTDNSLRVRQVKNAYELVKGTYSIERISDKMLKLYENLLANK